MRGLSDGKARIPCTNLAILIIVPLGDDSDVQQVAAWPPREASRRRAERGRLQTRVGRHSTLHSAQDMGLVAPVDAIELPFRRDNL